jgi:hypothetical protein
VKRCDTAGLDAMKGNITYTTMRPQSEMIGLMAISCVVGRVRVGTGNRWGIIDRSRDLVRPDLVHDPELGEEMDV